MPVPDAITINADIEARNRKRIYELLFSSPSLTKPELAAQLSLSLPTVHANLSALLKDGLVRESGYRENTGGRNAKNYSIVKDARAAVGLDITMHHVTAVVVNVAGEIVDMIRLRRNFEFSDLYMQRLGLLVDQLIVQAGIPRNRILGVGLGVPGLVTEDCTRIFYGKILDFEGASVEDFSKYIDFHCAIFNDAKAAGFAVLDLSDGDAVREIPSFAVLGLTGGSGAGKGAVSETLVAHGIPTLDTDCVSRLVCEAGQPCLAALTETFGAGILLPDGALDRAGLAAVVFGEPDADKKAEKLSALNRITHHYILEYARDWLCEQKWNGFRAACIDAPQLFESGFDAECSLILGVTAEYETRIARILARDGITSEKAEQRIAAQHDDAFFAAHCGGMIENNGDREALWAAVTAILRDRGLIA